jgi:uncharacterized lipoprotein YajG
MKHVSVACALALLAGCATTPSAPDEFAIVECEANADTGEVRNCTLISQSVEGSEFGAEAVATVSRGTLKPFRGESGWRKMRTTVRGTSE